MQKRARISCFFACIFAFLMMYSNVSVKCVQAQTKPSAVAVGKAECVMELNSRRILYASRADVRLPMASTTKILTAITVLENCSNIQKQVIIPKQAEGVEGSSVYLKAGEVYTVEDLLYGLMLRSGNDCATALALYISGDLDAFSVKMNQTAQKAGALDSRFVNPHGLPAKNHFTTAKDLTLITCYAMQNPVFRTIVSSLSYPNKNWQNKNKLLRLYDGAIGVKTGYTKEAGRCLVSAVHRNGTTLICTLLDCPMTYERTAQLFDDALKSYKTTRIIGANQAFSCQIGKKSVQCSTKKDFFYPLLEEEKALIEKQIIPNEKKDKNVVGEIRIYLSKQLLFSGNLYKL